MRCSTKQVAKLRGLDKGSKNALLALAATLGIPGTHSGKRKIVTSIQDHLRLHLLALPLLWPPMPSVPSPLADMFNAHACEQEVSELHGLVGASKMALATLAGVLGVTNFDPDADDRTKIVSKVQALLRRHHWVLPLTWPIPVAWTVQHMELSTPLAPGPQTQPPRMSPAELDAFLARETLDQDYKPVLSPTGQLLADIFGLEKGVDYVDPDKATEQAIEQATEATEAIEQASSSTSNGNAHKRCRYDRLSRGPD